MAGSLVITAVFIILGLFLSSGKGSFLIAGFNTLPKEDKQKYNSVALCKFMGKIMLAFALSMIVEILIGIYDIAWLSILNVILIIIICVFAIYNVMGSRFKK
ncbi:MULTISPECIES: DUF3784 domain-containing protein [Oceanobacillus]|uniref:DUF3784 domain-containing protein n=1 Tax=Oceanobacillus kimchii TaxID=746691 RepID=A0ABQ5TEY9_9BACI|nr:MULTISPECIES: DUF3784 domain-containing protein [Oceanobacillus]MBT2653172.1 DUF3784 domain-containing protein [Oceanobacillus sp. ISL-73]GLO64500.1 hypothetical protein MACH08_02840 [Oceanobacillus kimchii]